MFGMSTSSNIVVDVSGFGGETYTKYRVSLPLSIRDDDDDDNNQLNEPRGKSVGQHNNLQ